MEPGALGAAIQPLQEFPLATALILFAHGARDPAWAEPIRRVQAAILAQDPALRVEVAFLEFLEPSLADCGGRLAGEGYRRIVVLPMFIARAGHLKREVPDILAALQARHPAIDIELAPPVGEDDGVIRAMAAAGLARLVRK